MSEATNRASKDRIQALWTRFNNPEKQWSRAHTESLFNEIERLTRESEAWDKASLVAIIAERDRLREALQTSLRCLQAALGPGFKVEPLPQDSPSETSGAPVTATQLLEAVAGAVLLIRADICDCERDGEETHRHLCRKFGSPLKASARPSEGPGSILGCACIMCEYHRSAEDIERKRRAEAGESPCGG